MRKKKLNKLRVRRLELIEVIACLRAYYKGQHKPDIDETINECRAELRKICALLKTKLNIYPYDE